MRRLFAPASRVFVICLLAAGLPAATLATTSTYQDRSKAAPQMSADEQKALKKIQDGADAAAKLQAAEEYVKKYPKSTRRLDIARYLATEIGKVADPAAMTTLSQVGSR